MARNRVAKAPDVVNVPVLPLARPRIGFYVHHHGRGHAMRALQLARHLNEPVVVFTSAPHLLEGAPDVVTVVPLPSDVVTDPTPPPDGLHYAPLDVPGIRARTARLTAWFDQLQLALLVVDVSVEITLLARLCSVPTVVVLQHGTRLDLPHLLAYQSCQALVAPYAAEWAEPSLPRWIRTKTFFSGGFSRFDGQLGVRNAARAPLGWSPSQAVAVVLRGGGGASAWPVALADIAHYCPDWLFVVVGYADAPPELPANVKAICWVTDTFPYLVGADVVVASAGHNTVMEIAAARARYGCLPEARPFDEQIGKARALARAGLAVVREAWPSPAHWPGFLDEISRLDPAQWARYHDGKGAVRFADFVRQTADRFATPERGKVGHLFATSGTEFFGGGQP